MTTVKLIIGLLVLVLLAGNNVLAQNQDLDLANEYLKTSEYAKAQGVFQKLAKNKEMVAVIHKNYLIVLKQLKEYEEAEKFIKKQLKATPANANYKADYARLLEIQGKADEALKKYEETIESIGIDEDLARSLAQNFYEENQPDWAISTLLKVREKTNNENIFAIDLARLYKASGNLDSMIEEYLNYGKTGNTVAVQNVFQDQIRAEKEVAVLEKILYERVLKYPNESFYNEMLIWHLAQQKEFSKAFIQARAMDRRYKLQGERMSDLGFVSLQNKDYKAAGQMFEYLVKEYKQSANYPLWRRILINTKEEVIKITYPINTADIRLLIGEYQQLFNELGKNEKTLDALRSTAQLYAFYLNEKDTASTVLDLAISLGKGDKEFIDKCKLDLGDICVLKSEPWEATLLYSQVEKSEKDSPLGYEAKLRNAKLNYYKGEFELAQDMLGILKMATTREIANDALHLNLLIQDNIGLDTTEAAMKEYAAIDLLLFQNRNTEAMNGLNNMLKTFKNQPICDEVLWLRANTYLRFGEAQNALEDLQTISKEYADDIWNDDAIFMQAKIYEEKINDKEKAMSLYRELLTKYPGSIFGAEARKKFRILRGDTIN